MDVRRKIPMKSEVVAAVASGLDVFALSEKWKVRKDHIRDFCIRNDIPLPIGTAPPQHRAKRSNKETPVVIQKPQRVLEDDERRVVTVKESQHSLSGNPSGTIRVSLPRVTFIHGKFKGKT